MYWIGIWRTQGVKQGCLLSLLFNWIFDRVLSTAEPELSGLCFRNSKDSSHKMKLKLRAYADDVVLLSPDKARALDDFKIFKKTCQMAGLTVSMKKTKYLSMPDKLPEEKTTTPNIAPLQCVPPGFTNTGAVYYDEPRRSRMPFTGMRPPLRRG